MERSDQSKFEYSGSSSEAAVATLRQRQETCGVAVMEVEPEHLYRDALEGLLNDG